MLSKAIPIFSSALPDFLARRLGRPPLSRMRRMARQHLQRTQDVAELKLMSERELSDLGIGRGEIPALMETPAQWRRDRR